MESLVPNFILLIINLSIFVSWRLNFQFRSTRHYQTLAISSLNEKVFDFVYARAVLKYNNAENDHNGIVGNVFLFMYNFNDSCLCLKNNLFIITNKLLIKIFAYYPLYFSVCLHNSTLSTTAL